MNTEQERADFEAWYLENNDVPHEAIKRKGAGYAWIGTDEAWEIWQAAQAALQSQDREDAQRFRKIMNMTRAEREEVLFFACDRDVLNAIDHARRIEGEALSNGIAGIRRHLIKG